MSDEQQEAAWQKWKAQETIWGEEPPSRTDFIGGWDAAMAARAGANRAEHAAYNRQLQLLAAKAEPVQIDLAVVRSAIGRVLVNASNYPPNIGWRTLGVDMGPLINKATDAILAALAAQPVTGASRQQVVLYGVYESDGEPWLFTSDKAAALKALTHAADAGDGGDSYMVERAWGPRTEN